MDMDRLDLSALDPTRDGARWERAVARIMERARPELSRRFAQTGVLSVLGNWAWPTLAAAGVAAVLAGAALALANNHMQNADNVDGVVHFLGIAEPVAVWLDTGRSPTTRDVIELVEGEDR